jgi:hypothetical protein
VLVSDSAAVGEDEAVGRRTMAEMADHFGDGLVGG